MAHRALPNVIRFTILLIVFLALVVACSQEPEPTPTPVEPSATTTPTPTVTPTASQTPTPTQTPTPAPLTPAQIFDTLSPVVAFIDTPTGTGSGILIADSYLLTNAHVVWPFEAVRVVFADGEEFLEAPVINVDLMADLAIIGPLETEKSGVPLVNGEDLVIGTDVFLIGYPGEVNDFPQPTITRGLISRLREWEALGITYFQSDATIAGGQSGGVLVSEMGDVIGISGFYFSEAAFALVASAHDLLPRVEALVAGEQIDQMGEWRLPLDRPGREADFVSLNGYWDHAIYLLNEPIKTELEIELSGEEDGILTVYDIYGNSLIFADESIGDSEFGKETIEVDAPHFIFLEQNEFLTSFLRLESNVAFIPYVEENENRLIASGDEIWDKIDFAGDYDVFKINLNRGQVINIQVDSVLIDPQIFIVPDRPFLDEEFISDDDSGQGVFGLNAELTYEAPETGRYNIIVSHATGDSYGGYILTVGATYEGAPTPVSPPPTATPFANEFGSFATYAEPRTGFTMDYPDTWQNAPTTTVARDICQNATMCFSYEDIGLLVIIIEDLNEFGVRGLTLEDYVIEVKSRSADDEMFTLVKDEPFVTASGLEGHLLSNSIESVDLITVQTLFIEDGFAYTITYFLPGSLLEEIEPSVLYSLGSIDIP